NDRPRHPVSRGRQRRGPQRGDALMQAQTAIVSAPSLTGRRALAVLAGVALVAIAAQIAIPLPGTPVPMTLQPLAVLLVGGMLGPRLGAGSLVLYLTLGAAGLPVFTPFGAPGLGRLLGPTGGYLLAYPIAAYAVGRLAADGRRWGRRRHHGERDRARVRPARLGDHADRRRAGPARTRARHHPDELRAAGEKRNGHRGAARRGPGADPHLDDARSGGARRAGRRGGDRAARREVQDLPRPRPTGAARRDPREQYLLDLHHHDRRPDPAPPTSGWDALHEPGPRDAAGRGDSGARDVRQDGRGGRRGGEGLGQDPRRGER